MFRSSKKLEDPPKCMTFQEIQVNAKILNSCQNQMKIKNTKLTLGRLGNFCQIQKHNQQGNDHKRPET